MEGERGLEVRTFVSPGSFSRSGSLSHGAGGWLTCVLDPSGATETNGTQLLPEKAGRGNLANHLCVLTRPCPDSQKHPAVICVSAPLFVTLTPVIVMGSRKMNPMVTIWSPTDLGREGRKG